MSSNPLIAAIQSEDQAVDALIDKLDRLEREMTHGRVYPRVSYRQRNVRAWIDQPGGSITTLSVWTRNLSQGGMSIVLRTFVHPGSHCRLDLPQLDGTPKAVYGQVRWCRYLTGSLHEFGMQFEEPIELGLFLSVAALPGALAGDSAKDARAAREALAGTRTDLAEELARLIERPNLGRALEVCRRMQEIAARTDTTELHYAATLAVQALTTTGSVAESEEQLREVCRVARQAGA